MALFEPADGWWSRGTIGLGDLPAWPWRAALNVVRLMVSSSVKKLARDAPAPRLVAEDRWAAVQHMAPSHVRHHFLGARDRMQARTAVLAEIEHHIARIREDRPVVYRLRNRNVTLADLVALREHVLSTAPVDLKDPWPAVDTDPASLVARTVAVYSAAFDAYSHIVRSWFPSLADTLELAILLPVRLEAYVDPGGDEPWISQEIWPLPPDGTDTFTVMAGRAPPQPWEEHQRRVRRFFDDLERYRPEGAAWVHGFGVFAALELFGDRPATELAFSWLWRDLADLHLVERSTPTFRY
jgi:hypothetical protein